MAGNDWANTRASRMNDTQDSNMDEILASIRRIIAEDPIGSRPNPSTIHDTGAEPGPSLPVPTRGEKRAETRIEPSLPPLRIPIAEQRSTMSPKSAAPLPRNTAGPAPLPEPATDLDDIFETGPTLPAAPLPQPEAATHSVDAAPRDVAVPPPTFSRFTPRGERARPAVPPPPPTVAAPTEPALEAKVADAPAIPEPTAPDIFEAPFDTAESEPAASGPVTIASTPTNDADVENLLSRLAASLSAQASLAPSDDLARKTVADAVAAVAAANTQVAETPTEPVFEIIAESRPPKAEADASSASSERAASERRPVIAPLASTVPLPDAFEPGKTDTNPVSQSPVSHTPVVPEAPIAADAGKTPPVAPSAPVAMTPPAPLQGADTASPAETPTAAAPPSKPRSLEDSVADMLRPLLREWLDTHMPALLEKALREELAARLPAAIAAADTPKAG